MPEGVIAQPLPWRVAATCNRRRCKTMALAGTGVPGEHRLIFPVYQERGGATRSKFVKKRPVFSQLRFKARDIGGLRRSRNRKRPIDKLGFLCSNSTISSFALMLTDVSRLPAFVKWCLSCAILEGLRGTNGVADSVSSASCGRPATGPADSLNDQGDLQCHGQVGEVSCAFL